jgi:hypothetical protein
MRAPGAATALTHGTYVLAAACWLQLAAAASAQAQASGDPPELRSAVSLGAGAGVAGHVATLPTRTSERSVVTEPFPAFDLSLSAALSSGRWSVGFSGYYQTSAGLRVGDEHSERVALRAHSIRLGVLTSYRYGRSLNGPRLAVLVGWMVRGLRSVAELTVPAYTLHGPLLHPELQLPIARGAVTFRVGPELGWIWSASRELREATSAGSSGIALGAELALDFRIVDEVHLVLDYHGSYAILSTAWSRHFRDVEHVGTVRGELRY